MAKTTRAKKTKAKTTGAKKPNFNEVRRKVRQLAAEHQLNEQVFLEFAEFINGGAFKSVEPSMQDLKKAVIAEFGYSSYDELKKDGSFKLFVQGHNLKMTSTDAWLKVYRKFIGLPESEKDSIGSTSINGVDVLRNFLPWEVFNLNPQEATADQIKSAFNTLAKEHHPDYGGNPEVFERLKKMRDSILAAY